jgi:hypothetical protein
MGTRHNRKADYIHTFLKSSLDDLIDGLMKTGVDHLHPPVPKGLGDNLRSSIMAVQAGLRHQDPYSFSNALTPPFSGEIQIRISKLKQIRNPNFLMT